MDAIAHLIEGCKNQSNLNRSLYQYLARHGQSPEIAMVSCSDSRVDPALLTGVGPGEIFSIRNVAGLVPPCEDAAHGYHGTSAGLEFAVKQLSVKNIIVFGHSGCAGIKALMQDSPETTAEHNFVGPWMRIVKDAKVHQRDHAHLPEETQVRLCECEAVQISLSNLLTFDWIKSRVEKGELRLHGWYYNIEETCLYVFNHEDGKFHPAFPCSKKHGEAA